MAQIHHVLRGRTGGRQALQQAAVAPGEVRDLQVARAHRREGVVAAEEVDESNVITREVVTVDEQAPFTELVRLMAVHKVSALPVVDGEGRVVGLVSGTVPGVVDVVNQLTFALDDDRLEMPHSRSFLP